MIVKRSIFITIRGGMPSCETTKEFVDAVGHKFKESDN